MVGLISIFLLVMLIVVLIGIVGSYWLERQLPGPAEEEDASAAGGVAGGTDPWR